MIVLKIGYIRDFHRSHNNLQNPELFSENGFSLQICLLKNS